MKTVLYFGNFEEEHNTENYVSYAFRCNGWNVIKHQIVAGQDGYSYKKIINAISQLSDTGIGMVLFSKQKIESYRAVQMYCSEHSIPTVTWLWDLFFGWREGLPGQSYADYLFTTDGGHQEQFNKIGLNHYLLRQGIHKPHHKIAARCYKYDVGFVGTEYGSERRQLLQFLKRKYGGKFIHHTNTRGLDLNQALAECKIIVGTSVESPHYWSNRLYEITGRGGFLLYPETPGLDTEFRNRSHIATYKRSDWPDLEDKINYYLKYNLIREHIMLGGWHRCGEFTYTNRVKELLTVTGFLQPQTDAA